MCHPNFAWLYRYTELYLGFGGKRFFPRDFCRSFPKISILNHRRLFKWKWQTKINNVINFCKQKMCRRLISRRNPLVPRWCSSALGWWVHWPSSSSRVSFRAVGRKAPRPPMEMLGTDKTWWTLEVSLRTGGDLPWPFLAMVVSMSQTRGP